MSASVLVGSTKKNDDEHVGIVHMNHAGASPSPPSVLERVMDHMKLEQRLGGYVAAQQAQPELAQVYKDMARLLRAMSPLEIALVESATVAWTRIFYSMVQYYNESKGEKIILVSEAEYAANLVAACQVARNDMDWTVVAIPSTKNDDGTSTGILNVTTLEQMLEGRYIHGKSFLDPSSIALVCVTHVPTNSGIVNPVHEVGRLVNQYNKKISQGEFPRILYLVDACQSVGQMDVNVQEIKCHGLTGTGRKYLRGPRGTGFLYVPLQVSRKLVPNHLDHACAPVQQVPSNYSSEDSNVEEILDVTYKDGAGRFEFWESNLANKLGLGEAVRIAMDDVGLDVIADQCSQLARAMQKRLMSIPRVSLHHENSMEGQHQCGIVTFEVRRIDATVIKDQLWLPQNSSRFEVSTVPATSTPLDSAECGVPDLVRASLSYTNTLDEIDEFGKRLEEIIPQAER